MRSRRTTGSCTGSTAAPGPTSSICARGSRNGKARGSGAPIMKVGIVGAGAVGSACLHSLVLRGPAREIVVVNRNRARAKGMITDLQYGTVLAPPVELRDGD